MGRARHRFGLTTERALARWTAALICVCEDERAVARATASTRRPAGGGPQRLPAVGEEGGGAARPGSSGGRWSSAPSPCCAARSASTSSSPPRRRILGAGRRESSSSAKGPRAEALKAAADPRVVFAPFQPPAARHLRELAVYVLPSAWEAFPIGVLEAMACGVPQVATDVGGTREAVTEETGVLIAPDDPGALAAAVIGLLKDPERRARMAAASRERHAAHFTVERMVAGTAAVYDAL